MTKIAVIAGAGPAGLTAAYELLKRTDIRPIVCESTDAIGGIAQTYNYKGNRIDIGGHRFFSKSERVMDWWFNILPIQGAPAADTEELGHEVDYATEVVLTYLCPECIPDDMKSSCKGTTSTRTAPDPEKEDDLMLQRPRISRIFYRKSFFPYPIGITLSVARRLGFWNTFLIGLSYMKSQAFPQKDESHLDAFFINRFGQRLYATFFRDYTEKVWGIPCSEIKADWGAQRIKGLSLKRAVTHAVKDLLSSDFKKAQEERETSLITRFYYPKFGPGQMWETVTEQVRSCGGEVRMQTKVVSVKMEGDTVVAATVENAQGQREEITCDYFFSTMPVKHLMNMMQPPPPPDIMRVADGLIYRDFMTVGLLLNKLHVQEKGKKPAAIVPDNWIYVQEGQVHVGRVQIFNNWSPYLVAKEETVWIGLEYFVNEGDELWSKPDADMIALGIQEMEEIGFILKGDVLDSCVLRMPKAYPAYFGTYDELHKIRDYTVGLSNLFLIGRNGMHRYNNQDHSMLTAMTAVDNIAEGIRNNANIWEVNAERVYHEEKKA
ncbi:hypothetical protein COU78_00995 [Candidatus Peregrinibacteria bacterium CG10_big_fil_rev_8_21_14_0_10_49_24]|nr:MAG: hypothetical protein COV83_01245 [Candidatus Peregrinibacteria bacterium CG11_big_fil_rev_8_21_14_0_20_49_14]PIR51525.1 MAG: hypothetical protein COU78_00995 [Candidatus Peregrinibacteria bacterium CG10_big_fil_rev_8_21_14_0_10_49_24]PJA67832.1 MAG: hypothetical protein CO157_02345 [Candidatus Peregrinibacteria bacterium CG_4_9_14_3_um_filter_49_12]